MFHVLHFLFAFLHCVTDAMRGFVSIQCSLFWCCIPLFDQCTLISGAYVYTFITQSFSFPAGKVPTLKTLWRTVMIQSSRSVDAEKWGYYVQQSANLRKRSCSPIGPNTKVLWRWSGPTPWWKTYLNINLETSKPCDHFKVHICWSRKLSRCESSSSYRLPFHFQK